MAECKLNSIKDLISKSLTDGQISAEEFKSVLDELEKYNKMKENIRTKQTQTVLNDSERKKLIEYTEARVRSELKKNGKYLIFFNKITIVNDPTPKYELNSL